MKDRIVGLNDESIEYLSMLLRSGRVSSLFMQVDTKSDHYDIRWERDKWSGVLYSVVGEFTEMPIPMSITKGGEEEEPEACQSAIACQELEDYISQ